MLQHCVIKREEENHLKIKHTKSLFKNVYFFCSNFLLYHHEASFQLKLHNDLQLLTFLSLSVYVGRSGLAWLACGPHLEVVHAVTGERLSAYCFSGGGEHPPNVLAARDFSWLKRFGLYFMIYLAHLDVDVISESSL